MSVVSVGMNMVSTVKVEVSSNMVVNSSKMVLFFSNTLVVSSAVVSSYTVRVALHMVGVFSNTVVFF